MPTKRNLLYVAALGVALLALGAASPQWKGVSVRTDVPPTSSVASVIFPGTATALRFEGDGSGLAGIPGFGVTNDLASKADLAGATNGIEVTSTNQYWDVDTHTAQATTGSVAWSEGASGNTYSNTRITVWPLYSNAVGRVFGSPMTGEQNSGGETYHVWTWDAQPNAVGYHVYLELLSAAEETWATYGPGTVSLTAQILGGSDIGPKPATVARTNEVLSTWIVSGTEPGMIMGPTWTNPFVTAVQLAGATSSIPVNPVLASSNWTAYADPQFPVWSPPYFSTISTALYWLAQGPDGQRTNHAILKISGMHRLSGATYTLNDNGLDFLSIDAGESTIYGDVSSCGDVKGIITLGSLVNHAQVKGGKWIGFQNSNKNGMVFKMEGNFCGLVGVDAITEGSNWNATSAIMLGGVQPYMIGCMARISTNATGPGGYMPLAFPAQGGSTCLVMNCVFDTSAKPNIFFHLGEDLGQKAHQFIDCKFKFITSGSLALFSRVSPFAKWINCTFANATNAANQWPVIGRVGDAAKTNFVINCVFNQPNWFTNCIMISNNVSVADDATGFDGVTLTPAD